MALGMFAVLISPEGYFAIIVTVALAIDFCEKHPAWSWEELPPCKE